MPKYGYNPDEHYETKLTLIDKDGFQKEGNTEDIISDYNELREEIENRGIPSGGESGQMLTKASNDDYDVEWSDIPSFTENVETTVANAANTWLQTNITNPSNPPLDSSLSLSNAAAPADKVGELKSALNALDSTVGTYLVGSNKLYGRSSVSVGDTGQTYQQADFYTLEKELSEGERFTFKCDSIVGNTTDAMRFKIMNGGTQIRTAASTTDTVYVDITASDVASGANKIVFFVYASTGTAQTQACVLTNPTVYTGYATSEQMGYTNAFDAEVERIVNQSQPELVPVQRLSLGTLINGFVNSSNGNIVEADSYKRTDYIPIKTKKISVVITSAASNTGLAFYDDAKIYISGVNFASYDLGDSVEVNVPQYATYLVYCAVNAQSTNMQILFPNYADAVSMSNENPCFWEKSSECRVFKKILCIGDSLTDGQFDYNEGGSTQEINLREYAYPALLKAITGRDTTNAGDAGETTVSWYELHGAEDFSGHDACIIHLGRNDYAGQNNVSTADRIQAMNNIIAKVKADNPQIKIFISTQINYYTYSKVGTINADMATVVANNTDCYLLDIYTYGRLNLSRDAYSHCTAVGYYKLAQYYFNYISWIMHMNYSQFKNVQFAGTNHSYT